MSQATRKTACPKCGKTVEAASLQQHINDKHGLDLPPGLVLSRQLNEAVIIDGNIRVTVVAIRGDRVRLHFSAPTRVPIHREEVHRAICGETGESQ